MENGESLEQRFDEFCNESGLTKQERSNLHELIEAFMFWAQTRPKRICSVEGCGQKHKARGLCNHHYKVQLNREWRKRNPDKYAAHIKKNKPKSLEWRKKNPEKMRAITRKSYHKNKEKYHEHYRQKRQELALQKFESELFLLQLQVTEHEPTGENPG